MQWQVIVEGYREAQAINRAILHDLAVSGSLVTQPVAAVAEVVLDTLLPYVPVQTGTLQAAQGVGWAAENEAIVSTQAGYQNPVMGGMADSYVFDVVERKPFYDWAYADLPDLSDTALGAVEIALDGML